MRVGFRAERFLLDPAPELFQDAPPDLVYLRQTRVGIKKAGYLRGDLNIRLPSLLTLDMVHRPHGPGQQPGRCGGAILPAPSLS